jgi:hypothetical protein
MQKTNIIVDGHVHVYDCYDLDKFFCAAIKNLDNMYTATYPGDNNYQKVLLFTEGKDDDYFSRFKANGNIDKQSEYEFENTQEGCSIILSKNKHPLCYILAGRQIVTREKLEVLSVASNQKIEDGLPIKEVVKKLIDNKQIVVLAWGVGKWFFKRGKIIKDIIERYHSPYLFIGDNSARPSFWPTPKLYKLARENNIGNISGSDPLPFIKEQSRVGTYGFAIEGDFQPSKPAESFCRLLISNKTNMKLLGRQDNIFSFIKRQVKSRFL